MLNNLVFTLVIPFQCEIRLDTYSWQLNLRGKLAKPLELRTQAYVYLPLQSFQQRAVKYKRYRYVKLSSSSHFSSRQLLHTSTKDIPHISHAMQEDNLTLVSLLGYRHNYFGKERVGMAELYKVG